MSPLVQQDWLWEVKSNKQSTLLFWLQADAMNWKKIFETLGSFHDDKNIQRMKQGFLEGTLCENFNDITHNFCNNNLKCYFVEV